MKGIREQSTAIGSMLRGYRVLAAALCACSFLLALFVRLVLPDLISAIHSLLALAGALFLLTLISTGHTTLGFLAGRRGHFGINSLIVVGLFTGIVVLTNSIAVMTSRRIDLTAMGQFTLASQTENFVQHLEHDISIVGFFPTVRHFRETRESARLLLDSYRSINPRVSYRFVDPEIQPALARQYGVSENGSLVLVAGDRQKIVTAINERSITEAMLQVSGKKSKLVCFSSGHAERDTESSRPAGFSHAKAGLIRDLYKTRVVNLSRDRMAMNKCAVFIIAGASRAIPSEERKIINTYLESGGKLLVLLDPNPPPSVVSILNEWGLTTTGLHVVDEKSHVIPDLASPAVFRGSYPPIVINRDLDTTYFPDATALSLSDEMLKVVEVNRKQKPNGRHWPLAGVSLDNLVILPTLLTTASGRLTDDIEYQKGRNQGRGLHQTGYQVLGLMVIGEKQRHNSTSKSPPTESLTRLLVIGDSDFASNHHIQNGGNGDLFLNSVNWLVEEEHLIDIRSKPDLPQRLLVSPTEAAFIRFSSIGLIPLLVVLAGLIYRLRSGQQGQLWD